MKLVKGRVTRKIQYVKDNVTFVVPVGTIVYVDTDEGLGNFGNEDTIFIEENEYECLH